MEPDLYMGQKVDLSSSEYYFNRELSFLEFNWRVLLEAEDESHPLLERLKFVSILSSNLDEFYMIRVAGLKRQMAAGVVDLSLGGMTPSKQLDEIRKKVIPLYKKQEEIYNEILVPRLAKEGIIFHDYDDLDAKNKQFLVKYFNECVLPVLTPLSLDPAHPFPRLINRSLNIAFVLKNKIKKVSEIRIAIVQIPSVLNRFVKLERKDGYHFVLLEHIIKANAHVIFPGLTVEAVNAFRVTRDADIEIAEDEAEDLLKEIAEQVKLRRWGTAAVRLEVSANMPEYLAGHLMRSLDIDESDMYIHNRPLKLPDFMDLLKLDIRHLKDKPFQTRILPELRFEGLSIFEVMRKKDLLVQHPYDSFTNSVLKYIDEAADDPDVYAIKITLYRTGLNSPVVAALKRAAENGKDVTAFVELKARFDEENNIIWARELEHLGVHVIYGVLGLKTHCKLCLVIRKENDKLKTYLHLSTGNYNHPTSRLYTDLGLFTADGDFGFDAIHLFNFLTGYSQFKDWKKMIVAPAHLRKQVIKLIERETDLHTKEKPGFIFAKINALAHEEVIHALYTASQKGVKIRLLVRGICCLKPGIPGVSENIEIRSIIGRFLEHSRIFLFGNGGNDEFYLSSADWMTRNLHRRVEIMFPITASYIKDQLREIIDIHWRDNSKSWVLQQDGTYLKVPPPEGEKPVHAQKYFLEKTEKEFRKTRNKYLPVTNI